MKHVLMVGVLVVAGTVAAAAQTPASKAKAATEAGHAAPRTQPETAPSPAAPAGEIALGSVHLAKSVKADGKTLPAGTYQVSCALIVGWRSAQTDLKTSLNDVLREFEIAG